MSATRAALTAVTLTAATLGVASCSTGNPSSDARP